MKENVTSANFKYCGGSILNEDTILSAAHCIKTHDPDLFQVCYWLFAIYNKLATDANT
jgi:secreted trypsin-like serine protease